MSRYVIYDTSNGSIIKTLTTRDNIEKKLKSNEEAITNDVNANDITHYVDLKSHVLSDRLVIEPNISTEVGKATLSRLPKPTTVFWGNQSAQITDGTAHIMFDEPGTYAITLESGVAYQETEVEVTIP